MIDRAMNVGRHETLDVTAKQRPVSAIKQTSNRQCVKCRKATEVIVLYRNDAAVDYCQACWQHMPTYIHQRAVNVVTL